MPFELIVDCLKLGFPSVMADGSHLPLEENIAVMQRVVAAARPYGAAVEGELGQVGRDPNASPAEIAAMMTDPNEAAEFVERSGIDFLAVSVGSISGCFDTKRVELDLDRLKRIAGQVIWKWFGLTLTAALTVLAMVVSYFWGRRLAKYSDRFSLVRYLLTWLFPIAAMIVP